MFELLRKNRQKKRATQQEWPGWVQAYLAQARPLDRRQPWAEARMVVFDTETTGLDVEKDQILSIGAIAVQGEEIVLGDSLELIICSEATHDPEVIAIHGITPDEVAEGVAPLEAAQRFLEFIGGDILVAHHAAFDLRMIEELLRREGMADFNLHNARLDTAHLSRKLEDGHRSADFINHSRYSLDQLCHRHHITMYDRHTAWGDSLITAKLLLKLMRKVRESNPANLKSLNVQA